MSEERRKEIQASRAQSFLLDQQKTAEGKLVDGTARIADNLALAAPSPAVSERVAQLVHVGAKVRTTKRDRQKW